MKTKLLLVAALLLFALADVSEAGWRCGRWGGGYWRGGWYGGAGWYGGRYGWGWGPSIGIGFVAPLPVYRPVYVARPAYAPYYGSVLYRAQARLARLGYYPGPIDGDFGPMTSRAIRNYQLENGLPVTGRLDYRTRASLGV